MSSSGMCRCVVLVGSDVSEDFTLKMEAIRSSETSVPTRTTRRHILQDDILHSWKTVKYSILE
jgi:hypothetical protein